MHTKPLIVMCKKRQKRAAKKKERAEERAAADLSARVTTAPALASMPSIKITLEHVIAMPFVFGPPLDSPFAKFATRTYELGLNEMIFIHDVGGGAASYRNYCEALPQPYIVDCSLWAQLALKLTGKDGSQSYPAAMKFLVGAEASWQGMAWACVNHKDRDQQFRPGYIMPIDRKVCNRLIDTDTICCCQWVLGPLNQHDPCEYHKFVGMGFDGPKVLTLDEWSTSIKTAIISKVKNDVKNASPATKSWMTTRFELIDTIVKMGKLDRGTFMVQRYETL